MKSKFLKITLTLLIGFLILGAFLHVRNNDNITTSPSHSVNFDSTIIANTYFKDITFPSRNINVQEGILLLDFINNLEDLNILIDDQSIFQGIRWYYKLANNDDITLITPTTPMPNFPVYLVVDAYQTHKSVSAYVVHDNLSIYYNNIVSEGLVVNFNRLISLDLNDLIYIEQELIAIVKATITEGFENFFVLNLTNNLDNYNSHVIITVTISLHHAQVADSFRYRHAYILSVDPSEVTAEHREYIVNAINDLSHILVIPEVRDLLTYELHHLMILFGSINNLPPENNIPENRFYTFF